ncbi:ATP-binding protein, partial [Staphylococcus condimenti]
MELINGVFIATYQGMLLFFIAKIILNLKYSFKELLWILLINICGSLS